MSATEPRPVLRHALLVGCVGAALLCAPPAGAERADDLERGVAAVRAGGQCGALRHDPLVERAAEISNRSTVDYLSHGAEYVPVADPLIVLKDLGSDAATAIQLQGHGRTDAEAIKGALLQGYSKLGDCSYETIGSSVIRDPDTGRTLVVAVLAGP